MTDLNFWAAVQGVGSVLAAVAALIALIIAGGQLKQLVASNKLLAASNDAMTESNISLTRPYVVVDFEFRSSISRSGQIFGTSVFVTIRNDGKTPAHDITLRVDRPFEPVSKPDTEGWEATLAQLNRLMNGETVISTLTSSRPLMYYLDGEELFNGPEPGPDPWRVSVDYRDSDGRIFEESFTLEVEPWRRSLSISDPLVRVGKYVDAVAHELKDLKLILRSKK